MSDDTGILLFLGAGALVLLLIVVFGVLSSRRKKRATSRTWTVRTGWIGEQPFIESSDLAPDDSRQEELFRQTYPIGGSLTITVTDENGPVQREVHVSRVGRSLRAGFPQAKIGLTAYFREWEGSEFPVVFPVKGSDKVVAIEMDAAGVTARDAASATVWTSPWSTLLFSNGPDIVLAGGGTTVRFEYADGSTIEELLIKYGTLRQMHF
ncbi:hypothetical protein FQ142_14105 [Microbacterium sp. ANT_H45B]|uniref:hypothetical protein n=1 Tax=Microbacterium sp. ANT_H45B TaxID=2597346 RepID=UPI0011EBC5B8|nr:hypothetical protein [Microbacterium sp. ANT_H45B]KAA0959991.1 hypothetical protein FQ142_14105 [Microbacterium sp. ANT_H45B]